MLKKIIIGILVVVVVVAAGLLVFGLLNPTVEYESKVEINKPREVVWKYFTDPDKMGEWLEGFQKIETISGEPNQVGSKHRLTFNDQGQEIVMTETVTAFRENELFAFELDHEIMRDDVEVTLTDVGGKTIFVQKEKAAGKNILWQIMFAFMKSSFQTRAQEALEKIKSNVEKL